MQDVLRKTAANLRKVASTLPVGTSLAKVTPLDSEHILNLFKFACRSSR